MAFVGGVDLTTGRWDTEEHPLADDQMPHTFAGMDYYNPEKVRVVLPIEKQCPLQGTGNSTLLQPEKVTKQTNTFFIIVTTLYYR